VPDSALDSIFKAYDIRGIYPDEIDEDVARRVGNAFVAFSGSARVLVGRDARPSSEPLVAAFVEGALIAGADVIDLGLASTDLCYFAAGSLDAPAAMFTASHNPAEYNGIKMCRAGAAPIGQDTGLAEIKAMVAAGLVERAEDPGRAERRDMLSAFVSHVHSFVDIGALAKLRVVVDTANGVGGLISPAVFSGLPMDVSGSLATPTARSRTTPPIPLTSTTCGLQRGRGSSADVGLAFDGDADCGARRRPGAAGMGSTTTASSPARS
jgi:phosphomannomutase